MARAILPLFAAGFFASHMTTSALGLTQAAHTSVFAQRLTQAAAIRRATDFCRQIGAPVTSPPTVEPPHTGSRQQGRQPEFWLPYWRIDFPGQAWVEVVDRTGVICRYSNSAQSQRRDLIHVEAGPGLPQAEVIAKATKVLAATGQTEELGSPEVHEYQMANRPSAFWHQQTVVWKRTFQGVAYADDSAAVTIQPETGTILQVGVTASQEPPKIPNIKKLLLLDQAHAVKAARAHLVSLGAQDVQLLTGKLQLSERPELVQPNSFWTDGHASHRLALPLRPAWLITFKVGDHNGYSLWIDAENGRVIAGEDVSPSATPFPFKLHVKSQNEAKKP